MPPASLPRTLNHESLHPYGFTCPGHFTYVDPTLCHVILRLFPSLSTFARIAHGSAGPCVLLSGASTTPPCVGLQVPSPSHLPADTELISTQPRASGSQNPSSPEINPI